MPDVFDVANALVASTLRRHRAEISIIAYYGSHATGDATPDSDLDIFYIPVEGRTPDAARCFVVGGVTFDFWCITWETARRIAEGTFRSFAVTPAIIANATVLHARSEEDRVRLDALRRRISLLQDPEEEAEMVRRSLAAFPNASYQLEHLRSACSESDPASIRECGWRVVTICLECLALANQVTFDGGWARVMKETDRLAVRPPDLRRLARTIATSTNPDSVLSAASRLVAGTRACLRERQDSLSTADRTAEVLQGAYPEIHEHLLKLRKACQENDPVRASLEARLIQDDLGRMTADARSRVGYGDFNQPGEYGDPYREYGFPDLMAAFDPDDLGRLADIAADLDERIQAWLGRHGIEANVFEGLAEFHRWLDT